MSHGKRHRRRKRHGFFNAQAPAQNTTGTGSNSSQSSQSSQSQQSQQDQHSGGGDH